MKIWILKAIIQKIISFLPYNYKINYLFQKYITRRVQLTDNLLIDKLTHFKNHHQYYEKYSGKSAEGINVLEIGTGWYPIIPILFFLVGVNEVITIDISPLLFKKNLKLVFIKLLEYINSNKIFEFIHNIKEDRIKVLEESIPLFEEYDVKEILKKLNIQSIVEDARYIPIKDNSLDLIISNNTFEHIYPDVLIEILQEFKRISRVGAIMSHFIDMTDHFSHLDKSISKFHFLRFSDKWWKIIDNKLQPQNRLRINNYLDMFSELQFDIIEEIDIFEDVEKLKNNEFNKKFEETPIDILKVTHSHVISKF